MPGYLIGNSGGNSLDGQAKGVYASDIGTTESILFTATGKTRVLSCILSNKTPGILPATIYIKDDADNVYYIARNIRVKKDRHVIMARTEGDDRVVGGSLIDDTPSEIILNAGDSLCAVSPVDDSFDAIISIQENIQ